MANAICRPPLSWIRCMRKHGGYIDLDLAGFFWAIFIVGAVVGAVLFVAFPWLWALVKPWLHALTA